MKFSTLLTRSLFLFALLAPTLNGFSADDGIGPGSRLFVTKVHPGHGKLTEADFKQLADAGFTVAVDRWMEDVEGFCQKAADAGLAVMTWQMGMTNASEDEKVDRTVTRMGKTTRFSLPTSEASWAKVTEEMVEQAKLSLKYPNLKGALLDFEIYDKNKTDGFCESYDDETFAAFLKMLERAVPDPLPAASERRKYLDDLQVLSLYVEFQAKKVAEQARKLRKAVDGINPKFQIGVYGWGAFKEHIMQSVASTEAPVINLDATLYGRTIYSNAFDGGYDAEEPARTGLKWALVSASKMSRDAQNCGYPIVVLAGHYPQSPGPKDGSAYKFTTRQSFNSAAYADGYWIWTDWWLPEPWTDKQAWIDAMMDYWSQANAALDAGDWTWSSRQEDDVPNPNATVPRVILTTDGEKVTAWDAVTGKPIETSSPIDWPKQGAPAMLGKKSLQVEGWNVVAKENDVTTDSFLVGHATRAIAVADVDGIKGDELVTLNAGWVKIWDPESQSELLRFYVGADKVDLQTVDPATLNL